MGSIESRSKGSWRIRVYVGVDGKTGKSLYEPRTVHGTKSEANAVMKIMEADAASRRLRRKGTVNRSALTVNDLWEEYSERILWGGQGRKAKSEETRAEYERNWRLHVKPNLGDVRLGRLTVERIEQFHHDLLMTPNGGRGAPPGSTLSVSTVQKCHKLLSAMLTAATRWEWIQAPHVATLCGGVEATPQRIVRAPDVQIVRALLREAERHSLQEGIYFYIAALTGVRRGELSAINWEDVSTRQGLLLIDKAIQTGRVDAQGRRRTIEVVRDPKTVSSVRALRIDTKAIRMVNRYRKEVEAARTASGLEWDDKAFVFAADPGGQVAISKAAWSARWRRTQERIGKKGTRLHDLRHFVGVNLATDLPIRSLMDQLGHSRISTTGAYQVAPIPERAVETMSAILAGRSKKSA